MPHLHLPNDHTDADLVLAVNVAEVVGSEDLYVTWTHETGPGAIPEVDAVLTEHRRLTPLAALVEGLVDFVRALLGRPPHGAPQSVPPAGAQRQTAEPSA